MTTATDARQVVGEIWLNGEMVKVYAGVSFGDDSPCDVVLYAADIRQLAVENGLWDGDKGKVFFMHIPSSQWLPLGNAKIEADAVRSGYAVFKVEEAV